MARKEIDLTTPQPNGKMGEPTKSAWEKVNDMTEELYAGISENPGMISGFKISYNSSNSISISSGAISTQSGEKLYSPSNITKSGLTLSQFTWNHIYAYNSGGSVDIELSQVEPVLYFGTAKSKSGDSSKRYLGTVRAGTSGAIVRFSHFPESGLVKYTNSISENNILNQGKALTTTNISCANSIPSTSSLGCFILETGDGDLAFIANPDVSSNLSSSFNIFVRATKQIIADLPISAARSINYMLNPATTGLSVWCNGYYFER